ncbi:MAG TPA: histidine phosphatase family protein [Thermoflexales bacterium]|nr:histidine phosphatase family protein [Thermoflexales bacterium]HQW36945.1 histidine phosphatase family protein [Thermoflexales bacterium]HQZ21826.1 histidine phosphatase family protein [Thermoflexales bacterium]HRA00398.1 histidine phosphatase family protein [Thermoflexales bacterium]
MKTIEIRRHSLREKPDDHLNQAGVALARRAGDRMGEFNLVITSSLPRAYETAIAMGYAVNEQSPALSTMGAIGKKYDEWASFEDIAKLIKKNKNAAKYAEKQAKLWRKWLAGLKDGNRALVVSHGGVIEFGLLGCLPKADATEWGALLGCCEGVRLYLDKGKWHTPQILRITADK